MVTPHTALIYTMVLMSAADGDMSDAELATIGDIVGTWPAFKGVNMTQLTHDAEACAGMLGGDDGLEAVLDTIAEALDGRLRETAYALACDVAAADLEADQQELRLLEYIRYKLELDRLVAAAIEHAARARHATI